MVARVFQGVPSLIIGSFKMKQQRHLEIITATREVTQARALITDLHRLVDLLNVDIDCREQEAGVTDLARPDYPVLESPPRKFAGTIFALGQKARRSDVA